MRTNPLESKVARIYRARGYYTIVSAGSRGIADVVAIRPHEILLIQCKSSGSLPCSERQSLKELASRVGGRAIAALKRRGRLKLVEI